ncbi:MAG: NADH-quinone oxidoreductase subunit J [Verrucomicrobia bacterium]|nr:NADH-quinone oxidoreductase subunit J [Verrucomicrobiota bacterium]
MKPFPFADYLVFAIFAVAVGLTVGGALIAALSTRIIRGVSGLMISCVGLAGLYYFLNSPFLALMEILIYVGAVCVTIVFGVMLSEPDEPAGEEKRRHARLWSGGALAVSALVFAGVAWLSLHGPWTAPAKLVSDGSVRAVGLSLLTTYSLPFELISAVLLVAILGALVIARSGRTKE